MAGAALAILLLAFALAAARPGSILVALGVLGAIFAARRGDPAIAAPIYGGGLLLTAELAHWSLDERAPQRAWPGVAVPRLLAILAVTVAAIPASALVLLAAEIDVTRSPWLTAVGAVAVVACIWLLAALAGSRSP